MQRVPGADRQDLSDDRHAQERHIADQVEDLVAHEFIPVPEAVLIEQPLIGQNERVVQRPTETQSGLPERFDLAEKPEGAGRSDVADKTVGRPIIGVGLASDQRMVIVDGVRDAGRGGRANRNTLIAFGHIKGTHDLQVGPRPVLCGKPGFQQ